MTLTDSSRFDKNRPGSAVTEYNETLDNKAQGWKRGDIEMDQT